MSLRIQFVHAPDPLSSEHQNFGNKFLPLWALTLAPYLPQDGSVELELFDTRTDPLERIREADVYLFSGMNQDLRQIRRVHAHLKGRHPRARFVLGGPMTWSFEQAGQLDELLFVDHVAIGDGEEIVSEIIDALRAGRLLPQVVRAPRRFDLSRARPLHPDLAARHARRYYGALIEVSRGCPFLCEFCDIRIQPDNNRAHNKASGVIVQDLDLLSRLGITSFMLACDNFIGDLSWAHAVVDEILEWKRRTGFRPSLFTWLTINLYRDEALMAKMRRAGFDVLFIGIESFNRNSLLETAKVQNVAGDALPEIVRRIQAFGFVVTPGIIFGFDSDGANVFDLTTRGLEEACLLTCNPSLLIGLPGTPLYRRMKLAGRLRDTLEHIGRFKLQSNIVYLMPKEALVPGYLGFVRDVSDGAHQYRRLRRYFANLERGGRYVPIEGRGYGDLREFLRGLLSNRTAFASFWRRLSCFVTAPRNLGYAMLGLALVLKMRLRYRGAFSVFVFWMYGWTNFVMQNYRIGAADFDVECWQGPLSREIVLPQGYVETAREEIPAVKTRGQLRATVRQLETLLETRAGDRATR